MTTQAIFPEQSPEPFPSKYPYLSTEPSIEDVVQEADRYFGPILPQLEPSGSLLLITDCIGEVIDYRGDWAAYMGQEPEAGEVCTRQLLPELSKAIRTEEFFERNQLKVYQVTLQPGGVLFSLHPFMVNGNLFFVYLFIPGSA